MTAAQNSIWSPEIIATTLPEGVPAAPTSLQANPIGTREMLVAWTDNSDIETGFTLERRSGGGAWTVVETVASDMTAFTDEGLYSLTEYEYQITADGPGGSSTADNTALGLTPDGDRVVYRGNKFWGEEMFDGVTATWSGPYDQTNRFLRQETITVTLDNLPEHIGLIIDSGGWYANYNQSEGDSDTVTLRAFGQSDERTLGGTGMEFPLLLIAAHDDNSVTLSITGSDWENPTDPSIEGWHMGDVVVTLIRTPPLPPLPVVSIQKIEDGAEDPDPAQPLAGPKPAKFLVTRTGGDINQSLEVLFEFVAGTATANDVTTLGGSVVIQAGNETAEIAIGVR
jgi:hypothetical protein